MKEGGAGGKEREGCEGVGGRERMKERGGE